MIRIAIAADAGFLMPLAVTLTSLASAHEPGELAVTVLHGGLRESDRDRIEHGLAGRLETCWLEVPPKALDGVPHTAFLTRATLFRLLLPDVLSSGWKRVIYLDADTVVTGSLRPLWEADLAGYDLAAVRDAGAPFVAGPCGSDWRGLGMDPGDPYFNAGVLLIPLEAWRSGGVCSRALDLLREATPRWGDQDGLNAALRGRWKELPRRWNLQTPDVEGRGLAWALWRDDVEQALVDAVVIHYTDRDKPWHAGNRHPLASRWYDELDKTAWSGWRPVQRSRPLYRRVGSRTRRAWKVLTAPVPGQSHG